MRVLLFSHYYPPETHGGTQGYVEKLARLLAVDGHTVLVVAGARKHSAAGEVEAAEQDGVAVRRILRDLETENSSGDEGCARIGAVVERLAHEFAPDVIHVHHWHALTRDLVRRMKALGRPVVLTLHDLYTTCPLFFRMPDARHFCASDVPLSRCAECIAPRVPGRSVAELEAGLGERRTAMRAEMAAADRVLAVSRPQAEYLCSIPGFGGLALEILPIGIVLDEEGSPPAPARRGDRLRIVNWGGLDPRKGIHLLLEAVRSSGHAARFEIHLHGREGDPEYMAELRRAGEGLAVFFHGPFAAGEERRFAAEYDVAVMPFLAFETYALAVDEALRHGIPIVVSDHGAPPDRIGGRGLIFRNGDPAALRAVLERLLAEPARLAGLRRGSHAAKDLREHYRALLRLYGGLVDGAG
ncbi:MAG: glycosyltransferase [Planctomycetota bacterium]